MLSLRISNNFAAFAWTDIPLETNVGILHSNPAFFRETANDYNYPIRTILNEKLKFLFNWSENHQASTKRSNVAFNFIRHPAVLFDDGHPVVSGILELTEISEEYVEFIIKPNIGLINTVGNKKLKDFLANKMDIVNVQSQAQSFIFDVSYSGVGTGDIDCRLGGQFLLAPFNTDLDTTLADLCVLINATQAYPGSPHNVIATSIGNRITIAALWNGVTYDDLGNNLFLAFIVSNTFGTNWTLVTSHTSAETLYDQWYTEMIAKQDVFWPDANYCFFPLKFNDPGIVDPLNVPTPYTDFYFNYFEISGGTGTWKIPHRDPVNYQVIQSSISPFLYAMYVLKVILKTAGINSFTCDNNYNDFQSIVAKLCLINNVSTEFEEFIYGGGISQFQRQSQLHEIVDLVSKLPTDVTVKEYIDALCSLLNAQLFINNLIGECKIIPLESMLADETFLDWTDKVVSKLIIKHPLANKFKITYNYDTSDGLNDELTKTIENFTVVTVATYSALLLIQVGGLFERKTLYYCQEDKKFYRPVFDITTLAFPSFIVYTDDLTDFFTTSNQFDFPANLSQLETFTIGGDVVKTFFDSTWKIPNTKTPVTSVWQNPQDVESEEIVKPFGIRFMMNRGMQLSTTGTGNVPYPMGNYDNYDADNNRIDEVSLSLYGEDGLYERFYKKWIPFLQQARQIEVQLNLTHHDLTQLDFTRQIKIENAFYLIKQLEVEYPLQNTVKAILIKIEK